jgi:transposase
VAELSVGRIQVGGWRERYTMDGMGAIERDLPRGGRRPTVNAAEIVRLTTQTTPPNSTHWSARTLAEVAGASATSVRRVWRAHGLKPHLIETLQGLARSELCRESGRHRGPVHGPARARPGTVLRRKKPGPGIGSPQPGLPLKKGRAAIIMTHDYKRHSATTLFAALNTLDGSIISRCEQRHHHGKWLDFLRQIDRETPKDKPLHLICDNYATHKHPKVKEWLGKHPRFTVHFTQTSASWLNMVKRFFRDITVARLRQGVFRSVPELNTAIKEYITMHNQSPAPFVWTAKANDILQKVIRANRRLSAKQNGALR